MNVIQLNKRKSTVKKKILQDFKGFLGMIFYFAAISFETRALRDTAGR